MCGPILCVVISEILCRKDRNQMQLLQNTAKKSNHNQARPTYLIQQMMFEQQGFEMKYNIKRYTQ